MYIFRTFLRSGGVCRKIGFWVPMFWVKSSLSRTTLSVSGTTSRRFYCQARDGLHMYFLTARNGYWVDLINLDHLQLPFPTRSVIRYSETGVKSRIKTAATHLQLLCTILRNIYYDARYQFHERTIIFRNNQNWPDDNDASNASTAIVVAPALIQMRIKSIGYSFWVLYFNCLAVFCPNSMLRVLPSAVSVDDGCQHDGRERGCWGELWCRYQQGMYFLLQLQWLRTFSFWRGLFSSFSCICRLPLYLLFVAYHLVCCFVLFLFVRSCCAVSTFVMPDIPPTALSSCSVLFLFSHVRVAFFLLLPFFSILLSSDQSCKHKINKYDTHTKQNT